MTVVDATASGPVLQNSGPANLPTFADFTVTEPVTTGGPLDSNTINSLLFTPGGALTIFNTLTVTSGRVTDSGGGRVSPAGCFRHQRTDDREQRAGWQP